MSNGFGTYAFLSWLRRGVATGIANRDGERSMTRATIALSVSVDVNGGSAGPAIDVQGMALYGPGEVSGIDPRVVVRTWPQADEHDVEENYFPLIEFAQPDLPWRYTPAAANAKDRLRPWLCLIVLKDAGGEYTLELNDVDGQERPLPLVVVGLHAPLPKLSQVWAWCHVQGSGDISSQGNIHTYLVDEPHRVSARLLCPRHLEARTAYTAFVVPVFLRGRLTGLGKEKADEILKALNKKWEDLDALETAWSDADAGTRGKELELPFYYSWRFHTGLGGDFQYLVSLLLNKEKKVLPDTVGRRALDVQAPGAGMPPASATPMYLEGALKIPGSVIEWEEHARLAWIAQLTKVLNEPTTRLLPGGPTSTAARVVLPMYGRWYAKRETVMDPDEPQARPPWFHELNLNPTFRVAASLGTAIVQAQQQQLMAGAWRQVEGIRQINAELKQAQLAREVSARVYERHLPAGESLLLVTAPVQGRVLLWDGRETKTVKSWLQQSPLAPGIFEAQWRRVSRPLGPLGRRQGRSGRPESSLLARMNLERDDPGKLWVAKPPPMPSHVSTFIGAGIDLAHIPQDVASVPGPADRRPREYNPEDPDYVFEEPLETVTATDGRWGDFAPAVEVLLTRLKTPPAAATSWPKRDLAGLTQTLLKDLHPATAIGNAYKDRLTFQDGNNLTWRQGNDPLGQVMAAPEFPQPMVEPLRDLSQDWLLPGLNNVPPNTMSILVPNEPFIEAYMVGLNHEMARELLWNGFPTDQRGSYFRQFWNPSSYLTDKGTFPADRRTLYDIEELHKWKAKLGAHPNPLLPTSGENVILLLRGELLQRYPDALLYATRATYNKKTGKRDFPAPIPPQDERHPLFRGTLKPDISFFAFDLSVGEAQGCKLKADGTPVSTDPQQQGWYIVLQEQPSAMRFGLNEAALANAGSLLKDWSALSWGHLVPNVSNETELQTELAEITYIDLDADRPDTTQVQDTANPPHVWHADAGSGAKGSTSSDIASITLQRPVRVAVHASDMLPE